MAKSTWHSPKSHDSEGPATAIATSVDKQSQCLLLLLSETCHPARILSLLCLAMTKFKAKSHENGELPGTWVGYNSVSSTGLPHLPTH